MSEPTVIVVKDGDGNPHWMSSSSKMLLDGLADGTFSRIEEAPDEAQVPAQDDVDDAGTVDDGSSVGEPGPGSVDSGRSKRSDKPASGR